MKISGVYRKGFPIFILLLTLIFFVFLLSVLLIGFIGMTTHFTTTNDQFLKVSNSLNASEASLESFKDEIVDTIDQQAWLAQIAPIEICYINEFGVTDVVFDNLIRGEFHFEKISGIGIVSTWKGTTCFPSLEDTLIVDKVNKLTPHLRCLIEEDGPGSCEEAPRLAQAPI